MTSVKDVIMAKKYTIQTEKHDNPFIEDSPISGYDDNIIQFHL